LLLLALILAAAAGGGFYWWQQQAVSGPAKSKAVIPFPAEKSSPQVVETVRTELRREKSEPAVERSSAVAPEKTTSISVQNRQPETVTESAKTRFPQLSAKPLAARIEPESPVAEMAESGNQTSLAETLAAQEENLTEIKLPETVEPGGNEPESAKTVTAETGDVMEKSSVPVPSSSATKSRPVKIYVVHIGSFQTPERAKHQVERLRKKGFTAEILEVDLGNRGHWWRVIVKAGPDKASARVLQTTLTQVFPHDQSRILPLEFGSE
jgi:cell division septation protein DedD